MQTQYLLLLLLHIKSTIEIKGVTVTEVSADSHRSSIMQLQNKSMIIFLTESDLNIARSNCTVRSSHGELLDEELQVTAAHLQLLSKVTKIM